MAGTQGFEPRYAAPEAAVLPLDDVPIKAKPHFTRSRREGEEGEGREVRGDGWDAGIRTPIRSSRGCSLTVRRRPNKSETPFYQTPPRESTTQSPIDRW